MNGRQGLIAGAAGTAAMTMVMLVAPLMGMPRMAIGEMLGGFLGIGSAAGWAMHGVIGLLLGLIYAYTAATRFPGAPPIRGAAYGILVFLLAQLMVMPMMGAGLFSGGQLLVVGGSLMGHLVYGVVLGAVYGRTLAPRVA
jgi:uncharacterized protein DUF6789